MTSSAERGSPVAMAVAVPTELRVPRAELAADPCVRRDAAENRQRVLGTARALFAERGVDAVTMQDIARTAGLGQGTLYRRFPNKAAVCGALLSDNIGEFHDAAVARLERDEGTALEQLRWFVDTLLGFVEKNHPLVRAMLDGGSGFAQDRYRHPWMVWQRKVVELLLARAVARGEIGPVDVAATAHLVLGACDPPFYLHHIHQCGHSRERVVDALLRLLGSPTGRAASNGGSVAV